MLLSIASERSRSQSSGKGRAKKLFVPERAMFAKVFPFLIFSSTPCIHSCSVALLERSLDAACFRPKELDVLQSGERRPKGGLMTKQVAQAADDIRSMYSMRLVAQLDDGADLFSARSFARPVTKKATGVGRGWRLSKEPECIGKQP